MHELSISSEIAKTVLDTAEENKGIRVLSILLEIGEMTLLSVEQVKFWVQELLKGSIAEGAEINIKTIRVRIQCEFCQHQGRPFFDQQEGVGHLGPYCCPKCKSFQVKVKKGGGCTLRQIRMVR